MSLLAGGKYLEVEKRGGSLAFVEFSAGTKKPSVREAALPKEARGDALFEMEVVRGEKGSALQVVHVVKSPPEMSLWDPASLASRKVELPREMVRVERICTADLGGAVCVVGRDAHGCLCSTVVDVARGEATPAVALPPGAELKWLFYDGRSHWGGSGAWAWWKDHWELAYRPEGARDEAPFYERVQIPAFAAAGARAERAGFGGARRG